MSARGCNEAGAQDRWSSARERWVGRAVLFDRGGIGRGRSPIAGGAWRRSGVESNAEGTRHRAEICGWFARNRREDAGRGADGVGWNAEQKAGSSDWRQGVRGSRGLWERSALVHCTEKNCGAGYWVRRRHRCREREVDRDLLGEWGGAGDREPGAGGGWRVLQRECGRDGFGDCECLRSGRADLPDGRSRRERCDWACFEPVEPEADRCTACERCGERRHVAEARCLQASVAGRCGPVSYTHLRAHATVLGLVCRLLLEKKQKQ